MKTTFLAACWLAAVPCGAADFPEAAESTIQSYVKKGEFSGAVLVARDGKPLLSKGYGLANRELDVPNTPLTKFRLGSITKQFTAMAILQLEEKGKLAVTDPVCKYIPDCPLAWQKITIHHLLTHTSGIPNFTSFPDYLRTMATASPTNKTVDRFRGKPLEFEPGEKFRYSNSGYVLLGLILEKVAVESYGSFLRKNIFGPLGMRDSGYDNAAEIIPHRASGYSRQAERFRNSMPIDMSIPHAAGSLYSTVEDMLVWDRALYTEKLVSKKSIEKMFAPFHGDYAYAWFVRKEFNHPSQAHGGGINGFSTYYARYPEDRVCVVVLANQETSAATKIARELARLLFGDN